MAKQSHQKGSRGTVRRGLTGGLMQFFDMQPLLQIRRVIWGRRHRKGGDVSGPSYVRMKDSAASSGKEEGCSDSEKLQTRKEFKTMDETRNGVLSPKPRLTRTYSIHYLECDDYVENKNKDVSNLQSTGASQSMVEGSNSPEKLKTSQVNNDHKGDFVSKQTEDLFGTVNLYSKGKEIFLKILHDQNPVSVEGSSEDSIKSMALTKCSSFPRPNSSRGRNAFSTLKMNRDENRPFLKGKAKNQVLKEESPAKFSGNFDDFKTLMIDEMNKEHEKEKLRISMDGILHKIPYGQKPSHDGTVEKPTAPNWQARHKRSRSLSESIDMYSHFIDSSYSGEHKNHYLRRSRSDREHGRPFPSMIRSKTLGSVNSFNEFVPQISGKYSLFEERHPTTSMLVPTVNEHEPGSASIVSVSDEKQKVSTSETSRSDDDLGNHIIEHIIEGHACMTNVAEKEHVEVKTEGHIFEESKFSSEIIAEITEYKSRNESEAGIKDDTDITGLDTSAVSEHDEEKQEDLADLRKFPVSEDPNLKPESSDYLPNLEVDSAEQIQFPKNSSFDSIRVQIDGQDEEEFNYVRDILTKSGFSVNEVSSGWNSPDQPVGFSVFEELEGSKCRLDLGLYVPDINLDHLLLFDLINEVLLETYSSHLRPWLSSLSFHGQRLTIGSRVIEEVWAKINWHHRHKPQETPPPNLKLTFSHEDLRYDAESLGQELGDEVLDDLLDEFVLQLYDSQSSVVQ